MKQTARQKAEHALAKWKRKNDGVENASVNRLVNMTQADMRDGPQHCRRELSYEEALRILMIQFKDDSLAFAQRAREYLKGKETDAENL